MSLRSRKNGEALQGAGLQDSGTDVRFLSTIKSDFGAISWCRRYDFVVLVYSCLLPRLLGGGARCQAIQFLYS